MNRPLGFFALALAAAPAAARAAELEAVSVEQASHTFTWTQSGHPGLSADGRYVTFESNAQLTSDDTNTTRDVYIFDRQAKTFRRVPPQGPNRSSVRPSINSTGRFVAYSSYRPVVVHSTASHVADVCVYDQLRDRDYNITLACDAGLADAEAVDATLSENGRFVLFASNAPSSSGPPPIRQIYLFDRYQYELELVSQSTDGRPGNRLSADPKMSQDARFVAFRSASTNLAGGLPADSLSAHLYLLDRWEWNEIRIDEVARGFDADAWIVERYDMDDHGNAIVFCARRRKAKDQVRGLEVRDLFVFERKTGRVEQLTKGLFATRSHSPTVSADGRFVGFVLSPKRSELGDAGGVVIYDREQKNWRRVAAGSCGSPALSRDGGVIAFESSDRDVYPGARDGANNIFVTRNPFKE